MIAAGPPQQTAPVVILPASLPRRCDCGQRMQEVKLRYGRGSEWAWVCATCDRDLLVHRVAA